MFNKENYKISNKRIDDVMRLREYKMKNLSLKLKDLSKDKPIIWN